MVSKESQRKSQRISSKGKGGKGKGGEDAAKGAEEEGGEENEQGASGKGKGGKGASAEEAEEERGGAKPMDLTGGPVWRDAMAEILEREGARAAAAEGVRAAAAGSTGSELELQKELAVERERVSALDKKIWELTRDLRAYVHLSLELSVTRFTNSLTDSPVL